jgi:chromate reductase, NAD(P)H dehydrogenase (quinone)
MRAWAVCRFTTRICAKKLTLRLEAFRQLLKDADGVLFACPEYNYSVTGVLKNAIDWASRPEVGAPPTAPHALFNKPAAVMGVGGLAGTARAQLHLRQIAVFLNMPVLMKPEVVINNRTSPAFDEHGNLNPDSRKFLGDMLQAFVPWIKKFKE